MTESPLRNILLINLSLLINFAFFLPFPCLGTSVHISWTFSNTMLQWRSNAFTRPRSFLLLRQLINTGVFCLTLCMSTDNGPVLKSSSFFTFSSELIVAVVVAVVDLNDWRREKPRSIPLIPLILLHVSRKSIIATKSINTESNTSNCSQSSWSNVSHKSNIVPPPSNRRPSIALHSIQTNQLKSQIQNVGCLSIDSDADAWDYEEE